jgi:hypothetical protein
MLLFPVFRLINGAFVENEVNPLAETLETMRTWFLIILNTLPIGVFLVLVGLKVLELPSSSHSYLFNISCRWMERLTPIGQ